LLLPEVSLPSPDEAADFTAPGKPALRGFRKDHSAVNRDFENAIGAGNQFNFRPEIFVQFVSQTGSHGKIVSLAAIFDGYFHGISSCYDLPAPEILYSVTHQGLYKLKIEKNEVYSQKILSLQFLLFNIKSPHFSLNTPDKNSFFICTAAVLAVYGVPSALL